MKIVNLILQDELGARVVLPIPGGIVLKPHGVLRSISMGALSTSDLINSFNTSRERLKLAQETNPGAVGEFSPNDPGRLVPEVAEQIAGMTENVDVPPLFVPIGEEEKFCTCENPVGGRRCLNCCLLRK